MNTAGFIIARLKKPKKNSPVAKKKDKNNIFRFDIFIKNILATKKINNFKSNPDQNPDLKSENENYNCYKKVKIIKLDKVYRERKKLEP